MCFFTGGIQSRKKHSSEYGNHGNYHKELHKGKPAEPPCETASK